MNTYQFQVTATDIEHYGTVSGDRNPLHFDDNYAKESGFSGRIAHGMLTMAKVLSVVENEYLEPLIIILEYEFTFLAPVYVNAFVTLTIRQSGKRVELIGRSNGEVVLKGKLWV